MEVPRALQCIENLIFLVTDTLAVGVVAITTSEHIHQNYYKDLNIFGRSSDNTINCVPSNHPAWWVPVNGLNSHAISVIQEVHTLCCGADG